MRLVIYSGGHEYPIFPVSDNDTKVFDKRLCAYCQRVVDNSPSFNQTDKQPVTICYREGDTRIMFECVGVVEPYTDQSGRLSVCHKNAQAAWCINDGTEFVRLFDAWIAWQEGKQ